MIAPVVAVTAEASAVESPSAVGPAVALRRASVPHIGSASVVTRELPVLAGPWRRPRPTLPPAVRHWAPHAAVLLFVLVVTLVAGRPALEQSPTPSATTTGVTDTIDVIDPSAPPAVAGEGVAGLPPAAAAPFPVESRVRPSALPPASDYLTQPALPITVVPQRVPVYQVQPGDSLAGIAARFESDVRTLQWANGLADAATPLQPGQKLKIPPVKGVLHVVRPSDTLESIAATYGVGPQAITDYRPNQIRDAVDLVAGRTIVVPGGAMPERTQVVMHTVQEGETIFSIAAQYNITPETVVASNSLQNADFLELGQKLAILPVSGVGHIAQVGETVPMLAERFGVSEAEIRSYGPNGLGGGGELVPGQALVIPNGRLPRPPAPEPAPAPEPEPVRAAVVPAAVAAVAPAPARPAPAPAPAPRPQPAPAASGPTGRMTWPTTGSITTYFSYNGYGGHNGLDIANGIGTPIVAADGGVVTWAGWRNDGLGIAVFIDHGNGIQTWYGHFSRVVVSAGQRVSKGQLLGGMGSTGKSTGSHLHFMVVVGGSSYRNPLNYLP